MALIERKEPRQPLKGEWKGVEISGSKCLKFWEKMALLMSGRRSGTNGEEGAM